VIPSGKDLYGTRYRRVTKQALVLHFSIKSIRYNQVMLPIKYTYLLGSILFIIPWIFIYIKRRDLRTLLFQLGIISTFLGLIAEYFWWTRDWWKPFTITNTTVGIEDVILGFFSSGVCASLYLVLFKKKIIVNQKISLEKKVINLGFIICINVAIFIFLFSQGINSFWCTLITMPFATILLLKGKRNLFAPAIINGLLMIIFVIPFYLILTLVTPTFVEKTWIIPNLMGVYFLKIPIEDYAFYFLSGLLCFSGFIYLKEGTIKKT
jgi:hypothetical protein